MHREVYSLSDLRGSSISTIERMFSGMTLFKRAKVNSDKRSSAPYEARDKSCKSMEIVED